MTMDSHMKQGDTAGRKRLTIVTGEPAVAQDLTGATVVLKFSNGVVINTANGLVIEAPPTAGVVSFPPTPMNAAAVAAHAVEVEITFADASKKTWPDGLDRPTLHVHARVI